MSGEIITVPGRSADVIAVEIKTIVEQTQQLLLRAAIRIGQDLHEAKALVPHGEWGAYVEERCGFSHRTADNYMRLATEYGNSQTFANLPYSKALALLALPPGDREAFAAENQIEEIGVRELQLRIKELQAQVEDGEARAAKLQGERDSFSESADSTKALLQLATEENGSLRQRLDGIDSDYRQQLDEAGRKTAKLRAQLTAARSSQSSISDSQAAQLRAEGRAAALTEAAEAASKARKKAAEDADRIAELEATVAALQNAQPSSPAPAVAASDKELIKLLMQEIGERFNKVLGVRMLAAGKSPELESAITKIVGAQLQATAKAFGLTL